MSEENLEKVRAAAAQAAREQWVVTEGESGCRDRNNPEDPCACHGYGIQTVGPIPLVVCWTDDNGITPGFHSRKDVEEVVALHNASLATEAPPDELKRFHAEGRPGEIFGEYLMRTAQRREMEFLQRRCSAYARELAEMSALLEVVRDACHDEWCIGDDHFGPCRRIRKATHAELKDLFER